MLCRSQLPAVPRRLAPLTRGGIFLLLVGTLVNIGVKPSAAAPGQFASAARVQSDAGPILLGVWQPGAPWNMDAITAFERDAGTHVAIVHWYESWFDSQPGPDLAILQAVAAHGSEPMISWAPDGHEGNHQTVYSLRDIAAGKYDAYVQLWASQLASFGKPVLLRWAWEMNGDWFPWGAGVAGNTAADYVAAWQHLHDVFGQAGASNVQWVWSPNVTGGSLTELESFYPGDAYVDWLALDGYNRAMRGWQSFTDLFGPSYARLTALSDKPIMIAETSTSEADSNAPSGASKAQWIASALGDEIPQNFPGVRAVVWFNENKAGIESDGYDWRIESSGAAEAAFSSAVAQLYH